MNHSAVVPAAAGLALRLQNFMASAAVVTLACALYALDPHNRPQLLHLFGFTAFSFTGMQFLVAAALAYTALLGVHYLATAHPAPSKSLRFLHVTAAFVRSPWARWRQGLSAADRLAVLTTALKGFFGPLMVMSLMVFCMNAVTNGVAIVHSGVALADFSDMFDRYGFWFLMQAVLFIDVLLFTVGYLVELPSLGNQIRSVDSTLLGWGSAILCYPPFNKLTSALLGSPVSDFPQFDNPTAHLALNLLMIALMGIYASASVALGFKASNLTHRGIIARGPYRVIRHPAYVCKNMAWWIGSIPLVAVSFAQSTVDGVLAVASMAGWSMLYVLRALTEEDHLRRVDGEYAAYAAKVRYRFIPGLY
jgi:protein-S-isoprenylcysteine O-methyltransferase Ste14